MLDYVKSLVMIRGHLGCLSKLGIWRCSSGISSFFVKYVFFEKMIRGETAFMNNVNDSTDDNCNGN